MNASSSLIANSQAVVRDGQIRKISFLGKLGRIVIPGYASKIDRRVVRFVIDAMKQEQSEVNQRLWTACIGRFGSHKQLGKMIQVAERTICENSEIEIRHKGNLSLLQKWTRYGHDPEIFKNFPPFTDFLFNSRLLSQMKVTRDEIRLIDNKPHILVEGEWIPASQLLEEFNYQFSPKFNEIFIVHKQSGEVYTYLDNGKGLQLHHPFISKVLTAISTVSDEDYQTLLTLASEFERDGEEERPFILQIVSSYVKAGNTNFHENLVNRKHPYIRLIIGQDNEELKTRKGEVYEVGYGWKGKPLIPFMTIRGQFRSPDAWEYMPCEERVVTNIPLSRHEARNLYQFTQRYHNESINLGREIGFNLAHQNCSVYVRNALLAAGIEVPTEISLPALIALISPSWLQAIGRGLKKTASLSTKVVVIIPSPIRRGILFGRSKVMSGVKKVSSAVAAFFLTPIRFILGGAFGHGGRAFDPNNEGQDRIEPPMRHLRNYFNLSSYSFNLPGILQGWQRNQRSTFIVKNPVQFAILPNQDNSEE